MKKVIIYAIAIMVIAVVVFSACNSNESTQTNNVVNTGDLAAEFWKELDKQKPEQKQIVKTEVGEFPKSYVIIERLMITGEANENDYNTVMKEFKSYTNNGFLTHKGGVKLKIILQDVAEAFHPISKEDNDRISGTTLFNTYDEETGQLIWTETKYSKINIMFTITLDHISKNIFAENTATNKSYEFVPPTNVLF